jgi:ABC-type phosphate transport system substrate-binding protein
MRRIGGILTAMVAVFGVAVLVAQTTNLGQVTIPRRVLANGQPLAAGTYTVRLTGESAPAPASAQTPEQWVEFVRGGQVAGRELATVVPADQIRDIAKSARPGPGQALVVVLKSNEYLRVWLNHGGTNYLVHLVIPQ